MKNYMENVVVIDHPLVQHKREDERYLSEVTRMLFSSTEASSELSPLPFIFIIFHIGSSKLISPVLSLQCRLVISENFRTRKSYVSSISAFRTIK